MSYFDHYFMKNLSPEVRDQRFWDITFRDRAYSTSTLDIPDLGIAYRADSKEQFLQDASSVIVESGIAYLTGGSSLLVRTAIKRITELVDDPFDWIPEI